MEARCVEASWTSLKMSTPLVSMSINSNCIVLKCTFRINAMHHGYHRWCKGFLKIRLIHSTIRKFIIFNLGALSHVKRGHKQLHVKLPLTCDDTWSLGSHDGLRDSHLLTEKLGRS